MIKKGLATAVVFLLTLNFFSWTAEAQAQGSEHDALTEDLITLLGVQEQVDGTSAAIVDSFVSSLNNTLGDMPLTEEQSAVISTYETEVVRLYRDALSWSRLKPSYVTAYQTEMNVSELREIVEFLNSTVGQKLLSSQQQVTVITQSIVESEVQSVALQVESLSQQLQQRLSETQMSETQLSETYLESN